MTSPFGGIDIFISSSVLYILADWLIEAISLPRPSTFAKSAKLRRAAALKEKQLSECMLIWSLSIGLHTSSEKLSYCHISVIHSLWNEKALLLCTKFSLSAMEPFVWWVTKAGFSQNWLIERWIRFLLCSSVVGDMRDSILEANIWACQWGSQYLINHGASWLYTQLYQDCWMYSSSPSVSPLFAHHKGYIVQSG